MPGLSIPPETDTIVVGGGTGGAACAATLASYSSRQVLLLEAGPDYGPHQCGAWPADVLDAASIPLSHDWCLTDAGKARTDLPRARMLGGCSSHNGCTASLGARADYDGWATAGNPGWESATVEPLLKWVHERFRVRRYRTDELTVPQAAFVDAGLAAGLPFADDLDDLDAATGIGPMPVNIVEGTRWNAAFAFLDPVREHANLTIAAGVTVSRLLVEHGVAVGVLADTPDGPRTIRAGRVIVAAGAYHSPALLLRSGIGAADELRSVGVDVVADLPGVGRNLLDHPCVQLDFHGRDGLLEEMERMSWHPDEQTIGRGKSSRCDDGPYDIHVFMVAGANSGHPGLPPISLYGGAMRAVSAGQVSLTSAAPDAAPRIEHNYGSDPAGHDRAVLSEALTLLREMTAERGLSAVLGKAANEDSDPLSRIVNYCHPAGSCRMGPAGDPMAVVGADGAVRGVGGLYVADASVMPAITRGNPNLPVAMIGARIAAGLLGLAPADAVTA
ncbi:GMC family oxidoreductase [Amycolatopsis sp. NBC_01480]|uniref:GMC family oxidoreductase n=1 Tax=Amycolatopsis sp. NBC_01480 TaxID=2903562 RepID=UPI002E2DA2D4|nr:GMC family oxidoreductase N-terminal domain-containing protein [Amycolatopsis sp. NBC_01480]